MVVEPFFANTPNGRCFAISSRPRGESRGGIVFVPPFAEEMNKTRRMTALAARALADNGWHVLRFDLPGSGDSDGDFGAATWSDWLENINFWKDWLGRRSAGPIVLWGLRAGALLATQWLEQHRSDLPMVLWQPVTGGQQHLTQFLRLKAVADMLDAQKTRGVVADLRAKLASGSPIVVAGYTVNPEFANPMSSARLSLGSYYSSPIACFEVSPNVDSSPSPALAKTIDQWRGSGASVDYFRVVGPAFWRTVEIETLPELISSTVEAVDRIVR